MDEFTKFKLDKILNTLKTLNTQDVHLPDGLYAHLDNTLHTIALNVIAYYEGQYDEDEPGIASFNTQQLLDDLLELSDGTLMLDELKNKAYNSMIKEAFNESDLQTLWNHLEDNVCKALDNDDYESMPTMYIKIDNQLYNMGWHAGLHEILTEYLIDELGEENAPDNRV